MIATFLTILTCGLLVVITQAWWRSFINPVTLGVLVWLPGLIMVNWSPFFLDPRYIHLNRQFSPLAYIALAIGFFSFWAGCALVKTFSPRDAFTIQPARMRLNVDDRRLLVLFGVGVVLFAYSYLRSGLLDIAYLDEQGVAEARINLHLGWLSFLMFFLDISAIGFFTRFLQTGKWRFTIPMGIAIVCYSLTLQKSPVIQLLGACLVLAVLHPQASRYLLWRTSAHRAAIIGFGAVMFVAMILMNQARGIAAVQMTAASSPIVEQIYIYSGGSALMNLSTTIEGYLPSDPPTMGLYLARPITWYLVDRSQFVAGAYVEGINAPTYLIYGWVDFRWFGFFILPFATGMLVMLFLRAGLSGGLLQMLMAATAARAVIFSNATDVMFDPATWILLGVGCIAHLLTRRYRPASSQGSRPATPMASVARLPSQPPARDLGRTA